MYSRTPTPLPAAFYLAIGAAFLLLMMIAIYLHEQTRHTYPTQQMPSYFDTLRG